MAVSSNAPWLPTPPITPSLVKKSLNEWSNGQTEQVNANIHEFILPQWKLIEKEAVQQYIKNALAHVKCTFLQPQSLLSQNDRTPSFNEAVYVLTCIYIMSSDPNIQRFIGIAKCLQDLMNRLINMDETLKKFEFFQPARKKYSSFLEQVVKLLFEYSYNNEMHKTLQNERLEPGYALLFSVVPKALEFMDKILEIICSEIRGNAKLGPQDIDEWKKLVGIDGNRGFIRINHHIKITSTVGNDGRTEEIQKLRELLDKNTKELHKQKKENVTLHQKLDEQAEELEKKAKENMKLKQKLDEQAEEIKNLRFASGECKDKEGKCTHAQNNDNAEQEDELDRLLRESRQRAEQDGDMKLERNYSTTSNFAYGVFDSRGGNLNIKDADVELFIPAGAISTTQEIYMYIDPKARLLNPGQDDPPQSGIEQRETRVAPIVHCGPPGTGFLSHVVLTIPHNAENEDNWQFTPVRSEGDRHSDDWENIGTDCNDNADDDSIVIVNGGFCVFMVKHFTSFTLMKDSPN